MHEALLQDLRHDLRQGQGGKERLPQLSEANGRGLAMVSFIGFSTKGSRDEAIDEAKKMSYGGFLFFQQKSKSQVERNIGLKALCATFKGQYAEELEKIN